MFVETVKNLMFGAKDTSMLNKKMSNPGEPHNFSHTKQFLSNVGAAKIVAAFGAVSMLTIGITGLLDFFCPSTKNNARNGGQRRDHSRR